MAWTWVATLSILPVARMKGRGRYVRGGAVVETSLPVQVNEVTTEENESCCKAGYERKIQRDRKLLPL